MGGQGSPARAARPFKTGGYMAWPGGYVEGHRAAPDQSRLRTTRKPGRFPSVYAGERLDQVKLRVVILALGAALTFYYFVKVYV